MPPVTFLAVCARPMPYCVRKFQMFMELKVMTFGIEKLIVLGIFPIFITYHQRRNERGKGAQFPGCRITAGDQNVTTMSQALSLTQYICFRKASGSNMGAPNLFLAPWRHLTSLRPCTSRWSLAKMTKFVCKNTCPSMANYQPHTIQTKCC